MTANNAAYVTVLLYAEPSHRTYPVGAVVVDHALITPTGASPFAGPVAYPVPPSATDRGKVVRFAAEDVFSLPLLSIDTASRVARSATLPFNVVPKPRIVSIWMAAAASPFGWVASNAVTLFTTVLAVSILPVSYPLVPVVSRSAILSSRLVLLP
jgi:hypothetical protein